MLIHRHRADVESDAPQNDETRTDDNRTDETRTDDNRTDDARTETTTGRGRRTYTTTTRTGTDEAHEKFGGANVGAAFFGWLVAMGMSILLIGIAGAVAAGVGDATELTQTEAERQAGTIGLTAAIVLLVVLLVGYYAGGYVAGRMSRFDGARQGVAVWVVGLVVTIVAVGVGAVFGSEYNVLDRVDLPRIPLSSEEIGWAGIAAAAIALVVTLVGAAVGGVAGHRYHNRVDRLVRQR